MEMLARRLSRKGFADTGRAEEVDDKSLTLATDEIVEAFACGAGLLEQVMCFDE